MGAYIPVTTEIFCAAGGGGAAASSSALFFFFSFFSSSSAAAAGSSEGGGVEGVVGDKTGGEAGFSGRRLLAVAYRYTPLRLYS